MSSARPARSTPDRRRQRRARVRGRRLGAVVLGLAALGAVAWAVTTWSGPGHPHPASTTRLTHRLTTTTATTTATTTTTVATTTTTSPGTLPQTGAFPSTSDPQFTAEMSALWNAIVTDSPAGATSAFFPESAYVQLKTLGDPSGDFTNRLLAEYGLDIGATHDLLGPAAAGAQLVAVDVDSADGHWVPPGVCDNRVGYFEVPNSRMVYQVDGQTRSFGIASMISWRGEWYVVHLGAILRSGSGGEVADPQIGPGSPTPSSTC